MSGTRNRSRTVASRNVRVRPELRKQPDVEKLARALIAIAKNIAEKKSPVESASNGNGGEGDGVP